MNIIDVLEKAQKKIDVINKEIQDETDPKLKFIKEVRRSGMYAIWYAIQEKDSECIECK